ncbi:MAG: hypothetical protein RI976_1157 [Actinomycetota bacterium]
MTLRRSHPAQSSGSKRAAFANSLDHVASGSKSAAFANSLDHVASGSKVTKFGVLGRKLTGLGGVRLIES